VSDLEKLLSRSLELSQLAREVSDYRLRNILISISQEFMQEAERIAAIQEPICQLHDLIPWSDETELGCSVPHLDHGTRSLNPMRQS
jgi:hypothetical protein